MGRAVRNKKGERIGMVKHGRFIPNWRYDPIRDAESVPKGTSEIKKLVKKVREEKEKPTTED